MSTNPKKGDLRTELPPHSISNVAQEYLKTLSKEDLTLHHLAVELLGSSYFVERSKGFQAWLIATKQTTK